MTSLSELQARFQERLLTGADGIQRHLSAGGPFLKVYEHAYVARQQEILAEQYPAVHTLLGDERFARATDEYVRTHPPQARSARWIGDRFADWLRSDTDWSDQPVLADMATFEWALGLAFDAPDDEVIEIGAMAAVPPDAWPVLQFQMHSSLQVLTLMHDVSAFQQAVSREDEPTAFPDQLTHPQTWAVWRNRETLIVRYRALDEIEARGLNSVLDQSTFADLCDTLADPGSDDAAVLAAGFLRQWIQDGWVSDLSADGMSTMPVCPSYPGK